MTLFALLDSLSQYRNAVKTAKSRYFTEIIYKNCHKPKIIFNINATIHLLIYRSVLAIMGCFFVNRINGLRMGMNPVLFLNKFWTWWVHIKRCLETGTIPDLLKHAIVQPLLKKQGTVLAISNLSFITKILEKTVLDQLQTFLADHSIF